MRKLYQRIEGDSSGLESQAEDKMDSVKLAGWIAVGVSLVLVARVLLIDNPEAIIIIAPALIGGVAVVAWPWRRSTLVTALVLIGATAVYSLIGWIGFLYLPSLVLILRGVVRPRRVPTGQPS